MEVYYEHMLKLTNYLQHQINDSMLTIFFQTRLQPYLQIATMGTRKNTLFKHKQVVVTCEENMGDANEYWELLKPPTK